MQKVLEGLHLGQPGKKRHAVDGVMGWAEMLFRMGLPYDSEEALALGERIMAHMQRVGHDESRRLAQERGAYPNCRGEVRRNATVTTIAPTGTISLLAGCSSGIEPVFALVHTRKAFGTEDLHYINPVLQEVMAERKISDPAQLPEDLQRVFVTAHDIAPEWHVRMQAAFQEFTDNAVSKTINFPNTATVDNVRTAYELAYRTGCNGITIYRDGSRELQVLKHAEKSDGEKAIEAAQAIVTAGLGPVRRKLPDERQAITHKFRVGEQEGYITVGLFEDGTPVSYTHLRAHETVLDLVCRLLLEKQQNPLHPRQLIYALTTTPYSHLRVL